MAPPPDPGPYRLARSYLDAADDRFLPLLLTLDDPAQLVPIAEAWKRDGRPWARAQVVAYLATAFEHVGHEPVVKRLFKQAEAARDDELMAHFTVAFDRSVRRRRRRGSLAVPRNDWRRTIVVQFGRRRSMVVGRHLFSYHTRYYLRRRAWRYYRRAGYGLDGRSGHHDYPRAVAAFLILYTDADIAAGENLLDCRSLCAAMFGGGDVLVIRPDHVRIAPDRRLADLSATPYHAARWRAATAAAPLLSLAADAACGPVRAWAVELLRTHHLTRLTGVDAALLLRLLDHADPAVQTFAADLLERATTLGDLTVDDWLRLLTTRNLAALDPIARAMRRHVPGRRVSTPQAVGLAVAAAVPVARLGLAYLRERTLTPADHDELTRLADAASPAAGGDVAAWALSVLPYDLDRASRFFDSANSAVRSAAFAWVGTSPGHDDAGLYSRLLESPYDDVHRALVADLSARAAMPGQTPTTLAGLWAGVLLNVFRGGRAKLAALRQVSAAVVRDPGSAATLLPVLAVAIRSVRVPEARVGLAAIVTAVDRSPSLADDVRRLLPELEMAGVKV